MIRTLKVWHYKRRAKKSYPQWRDANNDLDCGAHMAAMLRPDALERPAQEFNSAMGALRRLGEPVPEGELGCMHGKQ